MLGAWGASTVVAIVAGVVGFFIVLRGDSFLAHAVPHGAFAGAAGAVLIGVNPLIGLGIFAAGGALTMTVLSRRRARSDVMTALTLTMMLALGAFFLSRSTGYADQVMALLFGQILGVSAGEIIVMMVIGVVCLAVVALVYRPLLMSSILPEESAARRISPTAMSVVFALVVAAAATMSVPVVGALLMFALLVAPPAAARLISRRPVWAICLSVIFALVSVWVSIALAYLTDWPVGFFVTVTSATIYCLARGAVFVTARRGRPRQPPA